jgi:multiple sugar transport system ATP-binding protein
MAEVVLKGLSKVFANGVEAVRDLDLQIAPGELVVLVGPSGSGKTTTLRLVAGLEEPTAGEIEIDGRRVTRLPPRCRNTAMVFQRATVYPHLTVRRNLMFSWQLGKETPWGLRQLFTWRKARACGPNLAASTQAAQVEETARLLGLEDVLDRLPGQLSGGQQQRLALGRALIRRPAVFLLDEPLSQLDARLRSDLRYQLHLLQRQLRATMIYVTHDQAEALLLADRVVVLKDGKVQQADSPQAVYDSPSNRFVAGFFGWPGMNFLDGRLLAEDGNLTFSAGVLRWSLPPDAAGRWQACAGRVVTLGVRPEDVQLEGAANAGTAFVPLLVESLGRESLITLERGPLRLTARSRGTVPQKIHVSFHMEKVRLFDSVTGVALTPGRPAG